MSVETEILAKLLKRDFRPAVLEFQSRGSFVTRLLWLDGFSYNLTKDQWDYLEAMGLVVV